MTNILELKFHSEDLDKEVTIREFFYELMNLLWEEKDEFSGKYAWGNSDWDGDLIKCLVKNKLITGVIDEDDNLDEYDEEEANKFVRENVIKPLFEIK